MNINETTSKVGAGLERGLDRMDDLGRTAGEKLDDARYRTAAALENAASSVRTTGRHGAETIDTLSQTAAGKLDSTGSHNVGGMLVNLRQVIARNPTGFLVLAASIGFLAGSAVRRNNRSA